ncbi:MAG: NAD(P)-dependent oxidoreductase [Rubellimicrobium sp.]|nr:NAD(P)-dependent oxidoreductase [Rubellimicrobium sp.]
MKVVVTGAAGFLGRHVADACAAAGHRVTGIDLAPRPDADWPMLTADLSDPAAAARAFDGAFDGAEAVCHCAAIPRPTGRAASEVFRVNMASIHAATEAARNAGARLFVQASSFSVLGYPFARTLPRPRRLPIDESHPAAPQDIYGTTKWLAEELIDAAVRAGDFRAVSLRMPWIQTAATFHAQVGPRRGTAAAAADLWAYLDATDAGRAFVAALDWAGEGHLRCYLSAADTYSETPTAELIARTFGDTVPVDPALSGHDSLISGARARAELGFRPLVGWRDYPAGERP